MDHLAAVSTTMEAPPHNAAATMQQNIRLSFFIVAESCRGTTTGPYTVLQSPASPLLLQQRYNE